MLEQGVGLGIGLKGKWLKGTVNQLLPQRSRAQF